MAVNVKMGVDIGGFTSGIKQGQQILKGLNAEMKASEAEFKATGDAEKKLNAQTKTLNSQLNVQKGIADQARQALKKMTDQGVDPADAAYQKLYVQLMNAEAGANEAQAALNALGGGAEKAADGADQLSNSLNSISKKVSLEQVRSGIDTITTGLENAAKKAVQLGEEIWNAVMDKAKWADDTATMAQMYGIDLDEFQRMQKLVTNGLDTSVEAMLKSQKKLRKGIGDESTAVMDTLKQLGLAFSSGKEGTAHIITEDETELFWKAGQALMEMSDAYDKESAAQAMFGRSWEELVPLFTEYKSLDEYNKALEDVQVVSEESVNALAELNDKYNDLKGNFDTLAGEVMGKLAPALTDAADALNGLLTSLLEYLKTDEGKQMLQDLGTAVSGLFDDLKKIDPEDVVKGFTDVFNTVVGSIQWLSDNWEGVVTALKDIVIGWGALKVTGGILDVVKIISGIQGITSSGAAAAGAAAGSAWGGAFAAAVLAAAPWLLSVIAAKAIPEENKLGSEKRVEASEYSADELSRLRQWVELQNELAQINAGFAKTGEYDVERFNQVVDAIDALGEVQKGDLWSRYWDYLAANNIMPGFDQMPTDFLDNMIVPVETEPVVPENAAADIAEQIGPVYIPIIAEPTGRIRTPKGWVYPEDGQHANGLWSVPYDGYLARLHKGERVMTAREVSSRSYNSNLYVESMYMNGGTDAAGLAAAMAAAQRRQMSGYGS